MEIYDFLNTPGTSNDSCLSNLELELKKAEQKAHLKEKHTAEELVKICAGINVSNITSKVEDLKNYLEKHDETCRRWLAQHAVLRWIPLEKNAQFLYHNFFQILNDDELSDCLKQETFRNINILLESKTNREYSNTGERTILRNYGHWLGLITVASDVPILLDELDLASLLLYAYTTGEQELIHVAPFFSEVLLASTRSRLFKASCSWLRPIYLLFADLLRRVHGNLQDCAQSQSPTNPDLSQTKQQITEIGAIIKHIEEQNCLAENEIEPPIVTVHSPKPLPEPHDFESTPTYCPLTFAPQFYFHEINLFGDYASRLEIPTSSPFFQFFPALERQTRQLFTKVVMEAIKEICHRSLPLSVPLSAGLMKTHLSQFQDESDLRLTALTTVRSLTSAVALLKSREFLPVALMDAIHKLFSQYVKQFENPRQTFLNMVDEAMRTILERNLEYAICYVIKSACNKSMTEMDKRIKEQFKVDGDETNVNILPKVQEMLDKLPPELSRNLTAEELCNIFPKYIFGFKQAAASINDIKKLIPTDTSKPKLDNAPPAIDPVIIKEKFETIFNEWVAHCSAVERPISQDLLSLLRKYQITFDKESISSFIKTCLQICTESSYKLLAKNRKPEVMAVSRGLCYFTVDSFSKLACLVIKNGSHSGISNYKMLHIVLEIFSVSLVTDHDVKQLEFNGLPFLRILMSMLEEFAQVAAADVQLKIKIMDTFKRVLLYIQPKRAPAFAFHWLEIIGHRKFIRIYLADSEKLPSAGTIYEQLLISLLKFLAPHLQTSDVSNAIKKLYEGTLRLMAILLHDFPDFFCEYYFSLCDVIPPPCIQLRNIVLCAFPKTMKPPEPFSTSFDTLQSIPEMQNIPEMSTQIFGYIPADARQLVNFNAEKPQTSVMPELVNVFRKSIPEGFEYNVPLLNAFISFVGYRAASYFKEISEIISVSVVEQHASMDIFQSLAVSFCSEGRYFLLNAIVNQLRYPSALTHYFACIVFSFFKQTNDNIKEQITHILFERLAAFRPHPWGLFITFIELIRNKQYKFWSYEFIHRYPNIRSLLFAVAKKCNTTIPDEYLKR